MPIFPEFAERTKNVKGSVFEKFRPKMQQMDGNLVKLHIGDTYLTPPYSIPIDPVFIENNEGFNRYCDTFGIYALRETLSEKVNTDNQLLADPDQILMTCGATNALNTAVQTLVNPGEDVIVLTPTWPFFKGMVTIASGKIIEAPLYVRLYREPGLDILGFLESLRTSKTVAIYLNTPNNPSGKVLNLDQLRQIADFAQKTDCGLSPMKRMTA